MKSYFKRRLINFFNSYFPVLLENFSLRFEKKFEKLNKSVETIYCFIKKKGEDYDAMFGELNQKNLENKTSIEGVKTSIEEVNKKILEREGYYEDLIARINQKIFDIEATLNLVSRKQNAFKKLTIIFLIHNIAAIDSILTVIHEAKRRGHKVILISINNKFGSSEEPIYLSEEKNHKGLERLGLEHLRFGSISSHDGANLIKLLNPDFIFKQSPWDNDVEEGYSANNLSFSRLCYSSYFGIQITKNFGNSSGDRDLHTDQALHRNAFAIFIENTKQAIETHKTGSIIGGVNLVTTGLPKYEYIKKKSCIKPVDGSKTILWAPHHSFDSEWLGFGTFPDSFKEILNAVEKLGFRLIFRPHPLFEKNLFLMKKISREDYDKFLNRIKSNPLFSYSMMDEPIIDFNSSDLLLTDGISMLATYQLTGKPIIWIDSEQHAEFTELGEKMIESITRIKVSQLERLKPKLQEILIDGKDDLADNRVKFGKLLIGENSPSETILEYLEQVSR
ncbi:hypothetical protein [Parasutterella muris]|uniref:CDP-glycerol--glycerophosphate glycerophosphotransferase n=1 Tax=Parasutterella muris TaxID=2565572 RepID=A0A6L6YG24_9BURK|nr:hypothetical protein [Parasutterella muris]MVX56477.1 hypothetical protein [Parasutterella muris]